MQRTKIGRPETSAYHMTQAEVGRKLRICRQQVDRIEKRALRKVAAFILKEGPLCM